MEVCRGGIFYAILNFLKERPDKAYTGREISEELVLKDSSVSANLTKMGNLGLVLHKRPYWMYNSKKNVEEGEK